MSLGQYKNISVTAQNRLVTIVFNRPDKLNAINAAMVHELHELMSVLEKNYIDHVLLFEGSGEKAFVAGADIAELKDRRAPEALEGINARLFDRIARFPFPTVAKIKGYCFGGGMELALACDIRIGSDDSLFAQPEVGLGIIPGAGATFRLPAVVGRGVAREMIFSGLRIDAKRAYDIGLLNHLTASEDLSAVTEKIISRILKQGSEAVSLAKRLMALDDSPQSTEEAILAQARLFESEDKIVRMSDFLEKQGKK